MRWIRGGIAVAYPFLVFAALRQGVEPRWVALLVAGALGLRGVLRWRRPGAAELRRLLAPALAVGVALVPALVANDARGLLFLPAAVNAALLFAFARTLVSGPPLVETFARLAHSDLSEAELRYCRSVTALWCAFFAANGAVALVLALQEAVFLWTLYTGLVSYLGIGLLFAAEFTVRAWRFGRYAGTPVEPLFRRLFPHGPVG